MQSMTSTSAGARAFLLFILILAANAMATIRTETVKYRDGDEMLLGYLAYDDSAQDRRPGILVVHEWWGLNKYVKERAEQLARLGYVAFAVDMYGNGRTAHDVREAGQLAGKWKSDRAAMRRRAIAALDALKKDARTDPVRIAAIGYCFGGTVALEMARANADLRGIVSFHGGLDTTTGTVKSSVTTATVKTSVTPGTVETSVTMRPKVLVLSGADDPMVPPEQQKAFTDEMRRAGADWQMVLYGGAVHSFTNPASGSDKSKGVAYNAEADRRSWRAMQDFLGELFQ